MAAVVAQITTPTVCTYQGRTGIVIYDNPNVTNVNNPSAYMIFPDSTFEQVARVNLATIGAATGPGAFSDPLAPRGMGPGQ